MTIPTGSIALNAYTITSSADSIALNAYTITSSADSIALNVHPITFSAYSIPKWNGLSASVLLSEFQPDSLRILLCGLRLIGCCSSAGRLRGRCGCISGAAG